MSDVKDYELVTIGNEQYKVVLLSTSRGLATSKSIIKLVLPTIGAGADGMMADDFIDSKQTFAQMAMLLIAQMDEVDTDALIKELLTNTTCNDFPLDFDQHFKGRYEVLIKLLEGALRANYGGLFTGMNLSERFQTLMQTLNLVQVQKTDSEEDL